MDLLILTYLYSLFGPTTKKLSLSLSLSIYIYIYIYMPNYDVQVNFISQINVGVDPYGRAKIRTFTTKRSTRETVLTIFDIHYVL